MPSVPARWPFCGVENAIASHAGESRAGIHRDVDGTAGAQNFFHIIDCDRQGHRFQPIALRI